MSYTSHVLCHHSQIGWLPKHPLIYSQIRPLMILKITRRSCKHLVVQISRKDMITWHEMWQSLQPHHCIVWRWSFYQIRKTCKITLPSSMAMYSVMRDIHDARMVLMERKIISNTIILHKRPNTYQNGYQLFNGCTRLKKICISASKSIRINNNG